MLNIVEILFLIFGWVFEKKGLVIAALVVSSLFLIASLYEYGTKNGKPKTGNVLAMLIQIPCLALSIIKLCL